MLEHLAAEEQNKKKKKNIKEREDVGEGLVESVRRKTKEK